VDELACRVEADAHAARVERLGELVHLADRDALDLDVHRRRVPVTARAALGVAEAADELDALAFEVIVDPGELLVEVGADRADVAGLAAAEELVELGQGGVVVAAVGLVDVDLDLFAERIGLEPDVAGRAREGLGPERALLRVVAGEVGVLLATLLLGPCVRCTRAHEECRENKQGNPLHGLRG
jgi:hypothetical protein